MLNDRSLTDSLVNGVLSVSGIAVLRALISIFKGIRGLYRATEINALAIDHIAGRLHRLDGNELPSYLRNKPDNSSVGD